MEDWVRWLFGLVFIGPLAWFWHRISRLENRHDALEKDVRTNYVHHQYLTETNENVKYIRDRVDMLIERQLNNKKDK